MATLIAVVGKSGSGKSFSFRNLDPKETLVINCDGKSLPIKNWKKNYSKENKNYINTSDVSEITNVLKVVDKNEKFAHIKTVVIDTLNGVMIDDEMSRIKQKGYDKWVDLAVSVYDLINYINDLRDDLFVVVTFHEQSYLDEDGVRTRRILTNGSKLGKIQLETKIPIVLFAVVEGQDGDNKYLFETRPNNSTAKTYYGLFEEFKIDNDINLVINKIREFENG